MTQPRILFRSTGLLLAALAVVVLAGALVFRVSARGAGVTPSAAMEIAPRLTTPAPAGRVRQALPPVLAELPTPRCWNCPRSGEQPSEFQVDLDLLAPLGDGSGNAALWLRDFAISSGARGQNIEYKSRTVEAEVRGKKWRVLPADDPLLLEAEPWMDQSTCSFYPEVWSMDGLSTEIPNLLLMLDLAKSWIVRGEAAEDRRVARDDFRRAIRLGRLLRQDDITLIQDLVAIAIIRFGAEALYDDARRQGDGATMVATALVMADKDAMRGLTAQRATTTQRIFAGLKTRWFGGFTLQVSDNAVEDLLEKSRSVPERRYRLESILALRVVRHAGTTEQQTMAGAALHELASLKDEIVSEMARMADAEPYPDGELTALAREGEGHW